MEDMLVHLPTGGRLGGPYVWERTSLGHGRGPVATGCAFATNARLPLVRNAPNVAFRRLGTACRHNRGGTEPASGAAPAGCRAGELLRRKDPCATVPPRWPCSSSSPFSPWAGSDRP